MAERFDVIVVGAGLTGSLAAATAAERGARVLLLEPGPRPGATGSSGGVARAGAVGVALEPGLIERPLVEHRMLVLDDSASVSFDFRDVSMAHAPMPAVTVRSDVAARSWAELAATKGTRIVTNATELRLSSSGSGPVSGVVVAGESFSAPVTVLTEPIGELAPSTSGVMRIEETFALPARSIENRFQLRAGQGTSLECLLGFLPTSWAGTGWVITHREHVTLGVSLLRPTGDEPATGLESAFDRFRTHPAIQGYTTGAERIDHRRYPVGLAPTRRALAAPGLLRAGAAAGLGDPVGVFAPGIAAALSSAVAAGEVATSGKDRGARSRVPSYLDRLKDAGVLSLIDRARAHPIPMGWDGAQRKRYARVLATAFHELLTETGAPKEPVSRTLRRVRRVSRTSFTMLATDGVALGRNL
jgi:electron transfer flavoprotein-quinone oxidoreductase